MSRLGWRVQALLWLLASAVLFGCLRPWGLTRDLDLRVQMSGVGRAWAIDWSPGRGVDRNGHWIDMEEWLERGPDGSLRTHGDGRGFRVRLPSYAIDEVGVRWDDAPAGGRLTVLVASVRDRVLGFGMRRAELQCSHVDGGHALGDGEALSIVCDRGSGGVYFPAPSRAWWYELPVALAAAGLAGGAWAAVRGLLWLAGLYERCSARWPRRERSSTWVSIAALCVIVAVPLGLALWAPVMVSGDGVAYMLLAQRTLDSGSFWYYDGWRLPGYAVLIMPFFATVANYAAAIGWAQAVMSMGPPLLAWAMLRRRVSAPWPQVAAVLIALDPAVFLWQRALLTETQTTLLVMTAGWLLVECAERLTSRRAWLWAVALGIVLAMASYTRANMQVFAVLAPVALAAIAVLGRSWRGIGAAVACGVVTAACLSPLVALTARKFSVASLTVGTDWNRAVWSWENGTMDWNQSGHFSFEQFREVRDKCKAGAFHWWDLPEHAQRWETPAAPEGVHWTTQVDVRCGALWREAAARRGDAFMNVIPRAVASMFGLRTRSPWYFQGEPFFALGPLLGTSYDSDRQGKTNILVNPARRFPPHEQAAIERTRVAIGDLADSRASRWMSSYFKAWRLVRPLLGIVFLFAVARLLRRGSLGMAALGVILLVHMVAVPVVVFTGADRYAMPWYGVMTAVSIAGLALRATAPSSRSGQSQSLRPPAAQP